MKKAIPLFVLLIPIYILFLRCNDFRSNNTVTDIDGNEYKTVVIGDQVWMAENLRTTTYNDGTPILHVKDDIDWLKLAFRLSVEGNIWDYDYKDIIKKIKNPDSLVTGGYCWYGNDSLNAEPYGALYNWYAVNTKKLCPVGWHVPTDEEWKVLEGTVDTRHDVGNYRWSSGYTMKFFRGYDAGKRLKSDSGWSGKIGVDTFGFNAYPAGARSRNAVFFGFGEYCFFWTANEDSYSWVAKERKHIMDKFPAIRAWFRALQYDTSAIERGRLDKRMGGSVRCVKTSTAPDADFSVDRTTFSKPEDTIFFRDQSHRHPTSWKWDFGDGTYSTSQHPAHSYGSAGTYTVSLVAKNKYGSDTVMKKEHIQVHDYGTVSDIEGNAYDIVVIGEQQWMAENLRTTRFNDGTPILSATDSVEWASSTKGAYCWYMNDSAENALDYGALYNGYAVNTGNLCPSGWRIATTNDWEELNSFLKARYKWSWGSVLKASWGWPEGANGQDDFGFRALPGGLRTNEGHFTRIGALAKFWGCSGENFKSESVEFETSSYNFHYMNRFTPTIAKWRVTTPQTGFSVRCVKDK